MKKIFKIVSMSLMANMLMVSMVLAAPLGGDNSTVVSQRVTQGILSQEAPADVALTDIIASTVIETSTGTAAQYKVDNARGSQTYTPWTSTVTVSNLANGTNVIPFLDDKNSNSSVYYLKVKNLSNNSGAYPNGVAIVNATDTALAENGSTSVSSPFTVLASSGGTNKKDGTGRFQADIDIKVMVPANTAEYDYTSTMTFTVS